MTHDASKPDDASPHEGERMEITTAEEIVYLRRNREGRFVRIGSVLLNPQSKETGLDALGGLIASFTGMPPPKVAAVVRR